MNQVYPAIFRKEASGGYTVFFPDIERGATQGETVAECIEMATDFLALSLYQMEEAKIDFPPASSMKKLKVAPSDIVTLISASADTYRRYYENRLVKKTLNIPSWLNARAEAANINFSQALQKALKDELNIAQ